MATLPKQRFEQGLFLGVGFGLDHRVNLAVHERVDAADKKAGDAGDLRDVLAFCGAGFESGEECFCNLFVSRLCEQQRDVDVDAVFQNLADGRNALRRGRNLDHDIGAANGFPQTARFLNACLAYRRRGSERLRG